MPRPTTGARVQTAYDLGYREGFPPPANIAGDPDLMSAFEDGVADREAGAAPRKPAKAAPQVLAAPKKPAAKKPAAKATPAPRDASPRAGRDGSPPRAGRSRGDRARRPGVSLGRPTLSPPRGMNLSDGSGFALGCLLYVLGINFLRHGPRGVTGWFAAKFVNRPLSAAELDRAGGAGEPTRPASPGRRTEPVVTLVAPRPARSA